ncbi:SsrA-binding protein [Peptoniphilus olsenii]|uniref:SsrA-binding protein n=1 Tax=Peptoniphilus olsenii TaxID=411570 RepID=A0ABV2JA83_9FIRM
MSKKNEGNVFARNKQAGHLYFIEDRYEAGIELLGTEVKSIRTGEVNLRDAYCDIINGEIYIVNMHISPYEQGNINNADPLRKRKLLMHKQEIRRLEQVKTIDGYTIIPLKLYLSKGKIKAEIAKCKGKKLWDKRETMKKREEDKKIRQALRY